MVESLLPLRVRQAVVQKGGKTILGPVDATIDGTGVTIVMGPNGSGKTTFLRLMHGLETPRQGNVKWNIGTLEARTRQAFIFQSPTMMRRPVAQNIAYPLRIRGVAKTEAMRRTRDWLDRIGLAEAFGRDAQVLSGGERQKLALARALISEPDVLFLDEPTANLDGRSTREIEDILVEALGNGTRIVMATHDIGQAKRLANEVVFLDHGTIAAYQPASAFFNAPAAASAEAYLRGDIVE